jgi:hypothetical protein
MSFDGAYMMHVGMNIEEKEKRGGPGNSDRTISGASA